MENIINSPFKFLDPYGRDDFNIFFGRDEEIKQLYQHIRKNRLVLIYGTSGTGKTSIVQCGLTNRMDDTDWAPFFIRRGDNINDSLCNILAQESAPKPQSDAGVTRALSNAPNMMNTIKMSKSAGVADQIYEHLKSINLKYLRPVYLIFDQFEELLIMGSEEEKATFINTIDHILCSSELQFCSMLFIMREEYFAGLSEFESEIPDFCDRRLRIEPMNSKNVEEVIMRSCETFDILLPDGVENARQIVQVLMEKNTISLPYLQIYLDQLWRTIYLNNGPRIVFDRETIQRFGRMKEVLDRFIRERIHVIQETLEAEFPDIPEDFVSNVLDGFVTNEGTKRPLAYLRINNGIWFTGQVAPYLQGRSSNLMIRCLDEMEKNKILRTDGQSYELAHDVIAGLIDSHRTEEQRRAALIDQQIRSRFTGFQSKTSGYLTSKEIEAYRPFLRQLNLSQDILAFYNESVEEVKKEEEAKLAQEQTQKEREENLQALRARQKKLKWLWALGLVMVAVITGLYFYAQFLRREYNRNSALVYMGYKMKTINAVDALNLFIPIKQRVYSEDTMWVQQKLLELMQTQDIQSVFAYYNDTLASPILEPGHIDISSTGQFIVLDNGDEYVVLDTKKGGHMVRSFPNISYAYFLNKENMLLLSRKTLTASTNRFSKYERFSPQSPLPTEFILFDCATGDQRVIQFGASGRYLHPLDKLLPSAFSAFDSYRVRYTSSGQLIVPYLEKGNGGNLAYTAQIMTSSGIPISYLSSSATVTTSRDLTQITTVDISPEGNTTMNYYNESGRLMHQLRGMSFGDFTEEGAPIYGRYDIISVLYKGDTLNFAFDHASCGYAYGDIGKQRIVAQTGAYDEEVEIVNMSNDARIRINEELAGVNFSRGVIYTHRSEVDAEELAVDGGVAPDNFAERNAQSRDNSANRGIIPADGSTSKAPQGLLSTSNAAGNTRNFKDTIWRRDLNGKLVAKPFTHADGIESIQYNAAVDELLILTKKNKLLLLNGDLTVKTGLQLTANDRFGICSNGASLYYVRDQFLSVFGNVSLDVFSAPKAWALIGQAKSPVKRNITSARRRELGLVFR